MSTTTPPSDSPAMLTFTPATAAINAARVGTLLTKTLRLETPTFLVPGSRGTVPHLSHDNLRDHTAIAGVHMAFEDFIERGTKAPVLTHPGALREYLSHPSSSLLALSARRTPPVATAATNTDSSIAILTSIGFAHLNINDYHSAVVKLRPDIAFSVPDIPAKPPGKNRLPKMAHRTDVWLRALLKEAEGKVPIFASVLPIDLEKQQLYVRTLVESREQLAGLALYDALHAAGLPEELGALPRLALDDDKREFANPHRMLQAISWGVDLFNTGLLTIATDRGVGLDLEFPGTPKEGEGLKQMGMNFWGEEYEVDTKPILEGCECYACRHHMRAYVHHLLNAKEMTAWVLLQIHNVHVLEKFFASVRESIKHGTFEEDRETFGRVYEPELPPVVGAGPRVRGYQFKTEPGPKKNPTVFTKVAGDQKLKLSESDVPVDAVAEQLEQTGFAEVKKE